MNLDQLALVCAQAATDLATRGEPLPTAVVLPLPAATKVLALPDFPEDDTARFDVLAGLAADVMVPANAPCFGFVAEAVADAGADPVDVVVVVFGARRLGSHVMAAPLEDGQLGEFSAPEPLDPTAMPYLRPLQHAADTATP